MASPKAKPPAMPMQTAHSAIQAVLPSQMPRIPIKNNIEVIRTKLRWFFIRPASSGTKKVNGSWASCISDRIQPAWPADMPRSPRITENHEIST
ncbi:hypothetical protein D3C80_1586090 [compost metagenome]